MRSARVPRDVSRLLGEVGISHLTCTTVFFQSASDLLWRPAPADGDDFQIRSSVSQWQRASRDVGSEVLPNQGETQCVHPALSRPYLGNPD